MPLALVLTSAAIIALVGVGGLLAIASIASGIGKLLRRPKPVAALGRVGVPDARIPVLGSLQILGGLGVVVGIWVPVIGVLSALALTAYYLGAVVAHLRIKDPVKELLPAGGLFIVALVTTVLEVMR